MPYDFRGKVCLITGAGSGIGRATALKIASRGATLSIQDINHESVSETHRVIGENTYSEQSDISSSEACAKFVDNTVKTLGRLDFVFNCAGINPTGIDLTDTTDEYFDKLVATNLKGTFAITRAAIPHLKPGSSIVNVSSIMGVSVASRMSVYCMTKFGINGFTKSMALELGPKGVRINAVAPGYIDTPTNAGVVAGGDAVKAQEEKSGMGRMGTAAEIADVVAFLFSEEARYMNGSIVEVTGGRT